MTGNSTSVGKAASVGKAGSGDRVVRVATNPINIGVVGTKVTTNTDSVLTSHPDHLHHGADTVETCGDLPVTTGEATTGEEGSEEDNTDYKFDQKDKCDITE